MSPADGREDERRLRLGCSTVQNLWRFIMKRILLSALLGSLSLAAMAQTGADQSQSQSQSVRIPAYTIETPAQTFKMMPSDLAFYKGDYSLSNGETLSLTPVGHQLFASVGDRPVSELVATGNNTFVAIDKQMKMTIDEDIHGQVKGELLMAVPSTGVAGADQSQLQQVAIR
jgi:hypothetical protein